MQPAGVLGQGAGCGWGWGGVRWDGDGPPPRSLSSCCVAWAVYICFVCRGWVSGPGRGGGGDSKRGRYPGMSLLVQANVY